MKEDKSEDKSTVTSAAIAALPPNSTNPAETKPGNEFPVTVDLWMPWIPVRVPVKLPSVKNP